MARAEVQAKARAHATEQIALQMKGFKRLGVLADAGFDAVVPYAGVTLEEVAGLVQDAIFSRGPRGVWRTGVFIGGRDIDLAMDMLSIAKKSMVPPFEVSVFADPSGAFTTAAGMMAAVERELAAKDVVFVEFEALAELRYPQFVNLAVKLLQEVKGVGDRLNEIF